MKNLPNTSSEHEWTSSAPQGIDDVTWTCVKCGMTRIQGALGSTRVHPFCPGSKVVDSHD